MCLDPSPAGGSPSSGASSSRHHPLILASIVAATLCGACMGGATDVPEDTVAREGFIGAFLDLRIAAVYSETADIGDDVRDSILTVYGVTGQDLVDFIETHGEDVEFMNDLWAEVEARLIARLERSDPDADEGLDDSEEFGTGDDGVFP